MLFYKTHFKQKGLLTLACCMLFVFSFPALAEIYKWVDADGNIHFSDKPKKGASRVKLPKLQTFHVNLPKKSKDTDSDSSSKKKLDNKAKANEPYYEYIKVASPPHNQEYRRNDGNVTFSIVVSPELREDDLIQLFVDGELRAEGKSPRYLIKEMDRGEHKVFAMIVDKDGVVLLKSEEITFFLQRFHINQAKNINVNAPAEPQSFMSKLVNSFTPT